MSTALHVEGYYLNRPYVHSEESAELTDGEFVAGQVEEPHVVALRLVEYSSDVPANEFIAMDCNRQHFTMRLTMRKGKRPKIVMIEQNVAEDRLTAHTFRSGDAAAAWCAQQPASASVLFYGFKFDELEYVAISDEQTETLTKTTRK